MLLFWDISIDVYAAPSATDRLSKPRLWKQSIPYGSGTVTEVEEGITNLISY